MTVRIIIGDALTELAKLPAESVRCCVTSPPYYGLRDYGVDGQLGLEATPDEYAAAMVGVFREVRRVLRADGTLWLNIGDSYADKNVPTRYGLHGAGGGIKPKDLIGIPWMLALALRADGWWLRQDIIWSKPNPMPESITDRCTKAHEYLFLLSKSERYWFDADAILEPASLNTHARGSGQVKKAAPAGSGTKNNTSFNAALINKPEFRNRRSVWTVPSEPFPEAHFATYPPALVEPCILAGCRKGGMVLDPFSGAGTTGLVADRLGRDAVLIELNQAYAEMAKRRIERDAGLFAEVA